MIHVMKFSHHSTTKRFLLRVSIILECLVDCFTQELECLTVGISLPFLLEAE